MAVIAKSMGFNELKDLIHQNLNTGRLILVNTDARCIGKTRALVEIAAEENLLILTKNTESANLINKYHKAKLAYGNVNDIRGRFLKNKCLGVLIDEGVPLSNVVLLKSYNIPFKTGLFTNHHFLEN